MKLFLFTFMIGSRYPEKSVVLANNKDEALEKIKLSEDIHFDLELPFKEISKNEVGKLECYLYDCNIHYYILEEIDLNISQIVYTGFHCC